MLSLILVVINFTVDTEVAFQISRIKIETIFVFDSPCLNKNQW